MARMKFTVLGSGSSGGVPRIGGNWGACDTNEPRNRRSRCSFLVERGETRVLVDTSPDLRNQLLSAGVGTLDAVLFTHDHADQCHGIDDLRVVAANAHARVNVYMDRPTGAALKDRFRYCFVQSEGSSYPAILDAHEIEPLVPVQVNGKGGPIDALPFIQEHGRIRSLGFRFGPLAYSSDVSGLPEESLPRWKASSAGSSMRCATNRIRRTPMSRWPSNGSRA